MRNVRLLLLVLIAPFAAWAGDGLKVADLAWLAEDWQLRDDEGFAQEAWLAPESGYMSGVFRLFSDGRFMVHEYMQIGEEAEGVLLRFKHFRPDYSTWEKDRPLKLELVELRDGYARFENVAPTPEAPDMIEYQRDGDRLAITISDRPGPDAGEPMVFELARAE